MKEVLYNSSSFFGNGTHQSERLSKALNPDYVQLDDRELDTFLSFVKDLSEKIKYFNLSNQEDGNWENFYTSDISVVLATIVSSDLEKIEDSFNEIVKNYYKTPLFEKKTIFFNELVQLIHTTCLQFNEWYVQIKEINIVPKRFENSVKAEFQNVIQEKIKTPFQRFNSYILAANQDKNLKLNFNLDFDSFEAIWELSEIKPDNIYFGKTDLERINSAMLQMRLIFRSIYKSLNYAVFHFRKYFRNSLKLKKDHNPNIGLLIAFFRLFRHVQNDYNALSSRLLEFYYENYLNLKPRPGSPDKVFVNFTLAQNRDRYLLRAGSKLSTDIIINNTNVEYQTKQDIEITKAEIESLKSMYLSRIDDLDTSHYKLVSHIYAAPVANSKDGIGGKFEQVYEEWPPFGEEQEYKPQGQNTMINGDVGFAISSPVLELAEGRREVTLTLSFLPETTRIFKRLTYDVHEKINDSKDPDEPKNTLEETYYNRIFNQIDNTRNFKIFLSGEKEWVEIDPSTITIKAVGEGNWLYEFDKNIEDCIEIMNKMEIKFSLSKAKPPIVPFNPDNFGDEYYDTDFPVLKILLNPNKQPFSYSFLQNLVVQDVEIQVKVDRIRNFLVYDDSFATYPPKNMYPFGINPGRNARTYIGVPELFRKDLTKARFKFDWTNMPETVNLFKQRYSAYKEPLHPSELMVRFGAISEYEIVTSFDDSLVFPFFPSTEGDKDIHDETEITSSEFELTEYAIDNLNIYPEPYLSDSNPLDENTKTGYFVIEIIEPRNAFSHNVYQNEVSEALNRNITNPQDQKKFPEEPITPFSRNLEISYEARTKFNITFGDRDIPEEFFHIHPFGVEKTYYDGSPDKDTLIPQYSADGYLYIGLKNINAPETLTLYFELSSRKTRIESTSVIPEVNWYFLAYNQWEKFDDSKILYDSTEGFTQSGIVKIQIPFRIKDKNDILDYNLFWIAASLTGDTELVCQIIDIQPHGVEAELILKEEVSEILRDVLPPHTINKTVEPISAINGVRQGFESFGGRPAENQFEFFARVSERIRHKGRGLTHWDIERLVLDHYAEVQQVKCLSYLSNPIEENQIETVEQYINLEKSKDDFNGIQHKEGLKVVVVPKNKKYFENNTPKFSINQLARFSQKFSKVTSPFTSVKFINPQYEYVRIICNIKFVENMNNGQTLDKLIADIDNFIAPWILDKSKSIIIGGSINENVIQNFIKGLPYVKFLTKFSLLHIIEEGGIYQLHDTAMESDIVSIIKARPWGVLLPDDNHEIEMVEYEEEEAPIQRVNTDEIIRFQDKVNILGEKKYIKIKNPTLEIKESLEEEDDSIYSVSIKL